MLARRIIACLDVRESRETPFAQVVKGVNFSGLKRAGDAVELAARYNTEGIDELIILDVSATLEGRSALRRTIAAVAAQLFVPLAAGGGIRSLEDARSMLDAGADKVSINSAAVRQPELITALAATYGSQAVVVAIDARRRNGRASYDVLSRSGGCLETRDAVSWAREAADRGAGEILLTSIDRDGTMAGFDCALTAAVSAAVSIPVIASGGAGSPDHFVDVFTSGGADAALAASIFHEGRESVLDLKRQLAAHGIPVRLAS